jgi:RNA recognition motif-containing protein
VTKIYVRNLDTNVTEQSVRSLFETYGTVMSLRMRPRQNASRPGSFAFIEMADPEASDAIRALHGSPHGTQTLHVIKARMPRPVPRQAAD